MVDEGAGPATGRQQALGLDLPLRHGDVERGVGFPLHERDASSYFINCEMNVLGSVRGPVFEICS